MASNGHRAARAYKTATVAKEPELESKDASEAGEDKTKTPVEDTRKKSEPKSERASEKPEDKPVREKAQKQEKPEHLKQKKKRRIIPIFCSLLLMPIIAALHLYVSSYMVLCAFVTMTVPAFIAMLAAGVYLYYGLSAVVRKLYYNHYGWKPAVYTIIYYLIYGFEYILTYMGYLRQVRTVEGYLFSTEGAFFSYVYKIFPLVILAQLVLALLRWLIRYLIQFLDQKAKEHSKKKA